MEILQISNFYEMFNTLSYPVVLVDEKNSILWINKKAKTLINETQLKEEINILEKNLNKKIIHINNTFYEINSSAIILKDKKYKSLSLFNISKRKNLEEKLIKSKKMFKLLSEQLPEAVLVSDEKIIYTNPAFEKMLAYSSKYLEDKTFYDLLDEKNKKLLKENLELLISSKKSQIEFLLSIKRKNNEEIWINIKTKAIFENEKTIYINVIKDITTSKIEREKLEKLASIDLLTSIYNRRKFEELFDREYKRSKRYKSELSIIFFDIDYFKKINDTYGHDVGDVILKEVSSTITKNLRETDIFARWGGEEFIILLPETNSNKAFEVAENIRIAILNTNFKDVKRVTISLGITQLKQELQKSFLKRADQALYKAKNEGRNISIIL